MSDQPNQPKPPEKPKVIFDDCTFDGVGNGVNSDIPVDVTVSRAKANRMANMVNFSAGAVPKHSLPPIKKKWYLHPFALTIYGGLIVGLTLAVLKAWFPNYLK